MNVEPSAPSRSLAPGAERIFGAGEMPDRIRACDWSLTPLGPIASWPNALVIAVNAVLANQHPIFLFWGQDLIQLYNDAAVPNIGPDLHPAALGQPARAFWADVWPIVGPPAEAALRGQSGWNQDQLVPILRHGRVEDAWFTYSHSPVRDEQGTICGVLVTALETTPRVLAERALRYERERLLAVFQQAPAFFALLKGPQHVFDMVNPQFTRLTEGRNVLGRSIREAFPEAVEQGFVDLLDRVYQTGSPFVGRDVRFTLRDEAHAPDERRVDFVYQPLREPDGSVSGILVFGVDLTGRREAETMLREQRERFDFATDAAQIGYWFCDLPFDKLIWDARVKEHFWLPPDAEVSIQTFYDILHPEDRERVHLAIEDSIRNRTRYEVEYRTVSPEGEQKLIHAIGRTAYDAEGRPLRFDGVTQDITALRQAQDARSRAEEALMRSEKLALVGRLAATISHEINNPLEAITNLLYLVQESAVTETVRDYTRTAQQELARVSHIVTHTLRFNRQTNTATVERLSDILDSAVAIYEARLRHSEIQLTRDYADAARLLCFGAELRQVFANLIANSFDATKRGGRLILRTREQTNWKTGEPGLRVTVADTGTGMDAATLRHLYEPFFTTKGDNGTGLGLWVSREILTKHHASIRVKSRKAPAPKGTVFSVWLPLGPGSRQCVEGELPSGD
ncbi:MAG TPA: ATP-binding protein [Acidobacteriaceae bacterium]|nr:ATP-binding protein [Acidobacteriaceae bacterium]